MSVKSKKLVSVENEKILTVEAGNVNKCAPDKTVIAFSVRGDGDTKSTKALVKGHLAYSIYNMFLAAGNSMCSDDISSAEDKVFISKYVTVSFIGFVKEERTTETILTDCGDFKFQFTYEVEEEV